MDIFEAIAKKDLNAVKELIKANPQVVNEISPVFLGNHGPGNYPEGVRPLMWATFVLRTTPGPDALIIGELLLGMAAVNKDPKALNASLNEIDVFAGRTALHWAAYNDNIPFLHIIQKFAETHNVTLNYNQRDNGGKTPTQVALSKGFRNFAKVMAPARLRNAGEGPVHMAIVGMGATGTGLFIRLIRGMVEAPAVYPKDILKQIRFSLIDSKTVLGRGMAYSDELNASTCILNVHAAGMSIDSTDGADFLNYIKDKYLHGELEQGLGEAGVHGLAPVAPPNPTGYYPRTFFGNYCTERLNHWIEVAKQNGISVDIYPVSVVSKVGKLDKGVMTVELKGSEFSTKPGTPTSKFDATHVFNATGHWEHKVKAPKSYETIPGCIKFPANRATLEAKGVFKQPTHVGVMGSSLSAIDAVFTVLLHPAVGYLTWEGNTPTYHSRVDPKSGKAPWAVTCYSRRGVWPKVRPSENRDVDAKWTSPAMYEIIRQVFNKDRGLDLKTCIQLLDNEMANIYDRPLPGVGAKPGEKKPLPSVLEMFDPLKMLPEGVPAVWWHLVEADVRDCDDGDSGSNAERPWVRWYQIIHGLFPVMTRVYRGLSPKDRAEFDKNLNTPFLWAFAPMPLHSARILLAMREAGVLDLHRTPEEEMPKLATDKKHVEYPYFDPLGVKKYNTHEFLAVTTGLGSDVRLDAAELTQADMASGQLTIQDQDAPDPKDENTFFLADDDSYEFLDVHGNHSPARRGVGFFTHASYFMIQAVPAVVGHTRNAAELYLAEFVTRLLKDPTKAIPEQKPFTLPLAGPMDKKS